MTRDLLLEVSLYQENAGARLERRAALLERFLEARLERQRLGLPPLAIRHSGRARPPK